MAYTKIITIGLQLQSTVAYAANEKKTSLDNAITYIEDENKTDHLAFVSTFNCRQETAYREMMDTKKRWNKPMRKNSVGGYHVIQSFAPGEVTPQQAHKIGQQLVEELLAQNYEVVIGTHIDRGHIHNHIVFNSVSFMDGKKYRNNFKDYFIDIRGVSDRLCLENGLSIIEENEGKAKHYGEWKAEKDGKPTVRSMIRQEVDAVIRDSFTFKSFIDLLEKRGYTVKYGDNVKYIAIKPQNSPKFIRLKSLGEDYTEEAIKARLQNIRSGIPDRPIPDVLNTLSTPPKRYTVPKGTHFNRKPKKLKGFIALYFHYMYLLGKIKKGQPPNKRAAFLLRTEILKFERYQRQFKFLRTNNIETTSQLNIKKSETEGAINDLIETRKILYSERSGTNEQAKTKITEQISEINEQLRGLRKTLAMCKNIEADATQIEEKLNQPQIATQKQNVTQRIYYPHR